MPRYAIGAKYSRGYILAHSPVMAAIAKGPAQSIEVYCELQTSGNRNWHRIHALPTVRFLYNFYDFSNPSNIGQMHTVSPEICFPLVRRKVFNLKFNTAVGLGYVTKPFDKLSNNINAGLGTHVNLLIRFSLESSYRIGKNVALTAGLSFTHWSIGALKVPNLGVNVPSFTFGMQYGFMNETYTNTSKPKFSSKPYELYVFGNASFKQISPIPTRYYPIGSLVFRVNKQLTNKTILCAGADFMYDGTIARRIYLRHKYMGKDADNFRAGIHIGYEFLLNNFSFYFNFGGYLYKKDDLDSRFYQRIGMQYRATKKLIVNLGLKTHFFSADFVELGLGYRLAAFRFKKNKNE